MRRWAAIVGFAALPVAAACAPKTVEAPVSSAAPDEDAILATVDAFFLGMAAKDADALSAIIAPGSTMVALGYSDAGAAPPRRTSAQDFVDGLKDRSFPDRTLEAYWNPTVLQRADLAVVWTPYRIDIAGARLHCGIDVFSMSRENGKWLVDSLSFTMEPKACPELEPQGVAARPVFPE